MTVDKASSTYFALFREYGDVVALGRLDIGANEALALVGYPARRLGVERRRLLHQLLAVERKVLEVRIAGERIGERHGDRATGATRSKRRRGTGLTRRLAASARPPATATKTDRSQKRFLLRPPTVIRDLDLRKWP